MISVEIPRREIEEGEIIPKGYGVAYYNFTTHHVVCYPIPFNIFANWLRKLYFRILNPSLHEIEQKCHKAYHEGLVKGWKLHQARMEEEKVRR